MLLVVFVAFAHCILYLDKQPPNLRTMLFLRTLTILCFLLTLATSAWSQDQLTAQEAYTYLQNERQRAREVVGEDPQPPLDSLQKAIRILQQALDYYHRPEVQALAQHDEPLFYRKTDILFDLSYNQVRAGQGEKAVTNLSRILTGKHESFYANIVNQDTVFAPIWEDTTLSPILKKTKAWQRVLDSDALQTSYAPNISEAEKVAGLSKLWSEAKYNFVYFDQVPELDWDQLYLEYLPKVRKTRSTVEYFRVLQAFYAHLQDGHTSVWAVAEPLADSVYGRPALLTKLVKNRVVVDEVFSDSLRQLGIRPGVVVTRVDGLPVREYAAQRVRPYQGGSTPQNVDVATYTYQLLRGANHQPVTITFSQKDSTFKHTLPRSGYRNYQALPDFSFRLLPSNIGYVALNSFENDNAWRGFEAAYDSMATTDALILDVRRNGGGDSGYGWNILGYLTDTIFQASSYTSRRYSPLRRAQGEGIRFDSLEQVTWSPQGKSVYTKPVVMLISGRTFSAAEDMVVAFDAMQRGTLIGETTGGSTGQPLVFSVPGGVMARVCAKRDTYPDGQEWVGTGLAPDIEVHPKVADLQAGRDTVLEAALEYLGAIAQQK